MKKLLLKLTSTKRSVYRLKVQVSIIIAELLALAIFLFWPAPETVKEDERITYGDKAINLETPVITRQMSSPPPPPKPNVPPEPVPDDEVIEEEINFTDLNLPDAIEFSDLEGTGVINSNDDSLSIVANPQMPPNVVKIVEAVMPKQAKNDKVIAEIWVTLVVDRQGNVDEANISRIRKYDRQKEAYVNVNSIGYGLAEATIQAALQWKFRPAKQNGNKVRAETTQIFTFGS